MASKRKLTKRQLLPTAADKDLDHVNDVEPIEEPATPLPQCPEWLRARLELTREEELAALALMMESAREFGLPAGDIETLAWGQAVDRLPKKASSGRPSKRWPLYSRLQFYVAVEKAFKENPDLKKERLAQYFRDDPRWRGHGALKDAYYEIKPLGDSLEAAANARGFSLLDDDVFFSV
jgi:hypothetical protein